ncbi:MAG: GNAT family N-acetyltransferase [Acidobacteria bacterium]|nr:GNAT family N-acetyltransferase [Acidobacteriota bacterium]
MVDSLTFRRFESREDYAACVALQRDVWGDDFVDVVPATILMVSQRVGGVSAGAFDPDGRLVGFVFGITGFDGGGPVHWSDMLAVRPEARGRGIGKRLKLFQRDLLLAQGVRRMHWTYDPLVARNANLNLNGLGARAVEYVPNMYGDTRSTLHAGLETDRFVVEWELDEKTTSGPAGGGTGDENPVVDVTFDDGAGLPDDPAVRIAVPADIDAVKSTDPERARAWQRTHRRAFGWYLTHGYRVAGLTYRPAPGDSWYLVTSER